MTGGVRQSIMDWAEALLVAARKVAPAALFDPPPHDPMAEQEGRRSILRANEAVSQWHAALRFERQFWERTRARERGLADEPQ